MGGPILWNVPSRFGMFDIQLYKKLGTILEFLEKANQLKNSKGLIRM